MLADFDKILNLSNRNSCYYEYLIEDEVLIHVEGKQARTDKQKSFKRKLTNARASCGRLHRLVHRTDNLTAKLSTGCSLLLTKIKKVIESYLIYQSSTNILII